MIENPSENPWIQNFYRKLQFNTVPIENPSNGSVKFPSEVKEVPLDILRAAIHGDVDAYGDIYEIYSNQILRYCLLKTSEEAAEDCSQEVWERVYRKLPFFEFIGIPFHHYLIASARHICIDWWRRQCHADPLPNADFNLFTPVSLRFESPEEAAERLDVLNRFSQEIAKLKPEQALALKYHLNGYSYEEISKEMGKTNPACRQLVHRAKESVIQRMEIQPQPTFKST